MSEQESGATKSKRPKETALSQQRLPACQPILTAGCVFPVFLFIGVVFIGIGVAVHLTVEAVEEFVYDYTNCTQTGTDNIFCWQVLDQDPTKLAYTCECTIEFELKRPFSGQVSFYYQLENFYQNHRRYVKSRDNYQLEGQRYSLDTDCEPFRKDGNDSDIAPCGAVANSLFNDSITFYHEDKLIPLSKKGIAWFTDRTVKFSNPEPKDNLAEAFTGTAKPPYWPKAVYELEPNDTENNGYLNEDLIVWMRTAALPNFRKLYRNLITDGTANSSFSNGLPAANYTAKILYQYPVNGFDGKKSFVISTISWVGGKNSFLGIAYIVVGGLSILLVFIFFIVHCQMARKDEEFLNLTENTPYL